MPSKRTTSNPWDPGAESEFALLIAKVEQNEEATNKHRARITDMSVKLAKLEEASKRVNDLRESIDKVREQVSEMSNRVAALQIKSGTWGAIGGIIPVALMVAYLIVKG